MRVVQLKRGRIVKFATIGLVAVGLFVLLAHQSGFKLRSESNSNGGGVAERLQQHLSGVNNHVKGQSYPEDLPVFLGNNAYGNFEPKPGVKVRFPKSSQEAVLRKNFILRS